VSGYSDFNGKRPKTWGNHTALWNKLRPIGEAPDSYRREIEQFCEAKHISFAALQALGTRVKRDRDKGLLLAYAGWGADGTVTAIKYRPVTGTSHDSFAEPPSAWLRPIIIGKLDSLDWVVSEGESDGARLYDLVGDRCAIMVLPCGAQTFDPDWARPIPRGANVALCYDADEDGDKGATKAGGIIGARVRRVRPPVEGTDWCDWDGDTEAFLKLAVPVPRYTFTGYPEFAATDYPPAEPLLGSGGDHDTYLAVGSLFMPYGADGSGKSTWSVDGAVHLAAGAAWLGIAVPRPVRVCVIENEGPPRLFQRKLSAKLDGWQGADPTANLFVLASPWGEYTFADAGARAELRAYCVEHSIDVVMANPTLGLGVGPSGRPDETQAFVDLLVECGLKADLAFWLLHHENKQGQISGDWGRHPDTHVLLARDGNRLRTKLTWTKLRWAERDESVMTLEWDTDTWGYVPINVDSRGVSDDEYFDRIMTYLTAHPGASTRQVQERVEGDNKRIAAVLKARFDYVNGPRNARLWFPWEVEEAENEGVGV
jgi:hypothetical protein